MLYVDYNWDLSPSYMMPDPELDTDNLGWQVGDHWKVVDRGGKKALVKVDPLTAFVLEGAKEVVYNSDKLYQFAVYSRDAEFVKVIGWIKTNKIQFEAHLNRTRFWIPESPELMEFLLTWSHVCPRVDHETDHLIGA
mgnify:CR=1 FL=1